MGIIHVLDKHTANLIAAGEVVERPASAIKEMLENCADAGATAVTVEIKDGGTSFIRITDNGSGMAREDTCTAILRHATSKIKDGSDLAAIGTLGFRGEALAAISAVSKMRILTKRGVDNNGTLFVSHFGEVIRTEDAGCPNGTTIIVEDIFENTPARRKFLKKNSTEATAVLAVCEKFALSRPEIAVRLINDGNVRLETPGDGNLKNAIYASLGREFAASMIPVDYEYANVRVHGFIGKPEICRPNRNMQNFFVNGRYIKSRTMLAALEEGFRGFCPTGKFPACVLFVTLDLQLVDVNIHPAKLEIKFSDERKVFDTLYFGVKNALSRGISSTFGFEANNEEPFIYTVNTSAQSKKNKEESTPLGQMPDKPGKERSENLVTALPIRPATPPPEAMLPPEKNENKLNQPQKLSPPLYEEKQCENPFDRDIKPETTDKELIKQSAEQKVSGTFDTAFPSEKERLSKKQSNVQNVPLFTEPNRIPVEKQAVFSQSAFVEKRALAKTVYIGEIFDTYLVVEYADKMYMIDKHAAHERIIYERIKHTNQNGDAQYLLEPISVTLTPKEFDAVAANASYFTDIGFEFEEFGTDTYLLRSKPSCLDPSEIRDAFTFLAGRLAEGNPRSAGEIFDRALYTAACKAAIKGGNRFTEADNRRICEEIFSNDALLYCPHGRPVLVEFTRQRVAKLFGRI